MRLSRSTQVVIVMGVLAATFLAALDATVVGTALPTIVGELGGLTLYPWVFSGYLLTSTTSIPLYGRLADMYGRKRVLLAALVLFLLGSVLCGMAQSMPQLVFFRAIQGLGAGGIIPVTLTILGDLFPLEQRARLQGLTSAVWGTSAVAGPAVGGLLTDMLSWRWVFLVNLPFGLAALSLLGLAFRERICRQSHQIDYAGALTLTAGLTLVMLGLLNVSDGRGWYSALAMGSCVIGALLLASFWWYERRVAEPIVPPKLVHQRLMGIVLLGSVLIGAGMFGTLSYLPLFVQGVLGGTALSAGAVMMPFAVAWSVASTISGRVILRFGFRSSVLTGMVAMTAAGLVLQVVPRVNNLPVAMTAAGLFGVGMGFSATAFLIAVQNSVGWRERGIATALVGFARSIGGAVGVAALGAVLSTALAAPHDSVRNGLADVLLRPEARAALQSGMLAELQSMLRHALGLVYLVIFALVLVAVVLVAWGFPRGELGTREHQAEMM
ncbi:MAG: MDR family MFS transporter [Thermomicrobium sp.]